MARVRLTRRRLGRWLRGATDLAGLLGLGRDDREGLAWQAHDQLRRGRPAEAERLYMLLDDLWPSEGVAARLGMGVCRLLLNDLTGAEQALDEALALSPSDVFALVNRAEVLIRSGRTDAAREDLVAAKLVLDREGGPAELRARVGRLSEGRAEDRAWRPRRT